MLEGRRRFALRVRLAPALRGDLEAIRRLPVRVAGGTYRAARWIWRDVQVRRTSRC